MILSLVLLTVGVFGFSTCHHKHFQLLLGYRPNTGTLTAIKILSTLLMVISIIMLPKQPHYGLSWVLWASWLSFAIIAAASLISFKQSKK
ncbi:MAG: hypothetical protein ACPGUD_10505 [Parashewanella sp.]